MAVAAGANALINGGRRPPVRLSDVALRAGCSAATVSRVINAPETVNSEARARVEAAIVELGYTRNAAARALRSRRSRIVGAILPTLRQPVYADFVDALQDGLGRAGYALIVTTSDHSVERELFQARLLVERDVDGLVLVGYHHRPELFALLDAQDRPFIFAFTLRREARRPVVGIDNADAARKLVEHLHALGHRDFGVLSGILADSDRQLERLEGTVAALASLGLVLPPHRAVQVVATVEGGRRGLRQMLAAAERPSALMCLSDMLAVGALIESRVQGIAVPADMSVTGFDDVETSGQVVPALTTLAVPSGEMGRQAAAHLVARLAGQPFPDRTALDTALVLRDSTAPPPTRERTAGPSPRPAGSERVGLRRRGGKVS